MPGQNIGVKRYKVNRIQTRALVEGAIFASITVVIGVVRFYIPIIALISIIWSVPTILISFRHGFKVSIYSVVASSLLVALMTQPVEGLGFFIGFGLPGIIMGYLLKRKLSPWNTVFITGIVLSVSSIASLYLGMLVTGMDIVKTYNQMFINMKNAYSDAANSMADMYNLTGANREQFLNGIASFQKSLDTVKLILPGGILMSGLLISFLNFKLTRIVLRRINYIIEDVKPFSLWRLSRNWMFVVLVLLVFAMAEIYYIKLPQLNTLAMNIFTVITLLFIVLGLSAAKFFLDKYSVPKAIKGIILALLLLAFGNITMLVGIIDCVLDIRKLNKS